MKKLNQSTAAKDSLGEPGKFPFTRGIHPGMYRDRLWTMRQYAGFGDTAKSNERYRCLISEGINGLSVAFDLPTQMGYDSDHQLAIGEVGKAGVPICSLAEMGRLFEGIPLGKVSTSMTINATAMILLAFYFATARSQGVDTKSLRGTVQNDILKEYIARGTYIYPPKSSMRIVTDLFAWTSREMPKWNPISISGYHMREAGATAVQEVAFTLGNATAYIQAAVDAGLEIEEFVPRMSFFLSADRNLLEEIAKFRAARRLYARLMKERFGAKSDRLMKFRFHAQTAGSTLTAQQPLVNVVRTTYEAMAAILGGAQSLHTNGFDEAMALPTEESAKLALRTQQVLAYESRIANTVDPLGGSYLVEQLTDEIEDGARHYLDDVEAMGGMVASVEQGFVQREIQNAAYEYQKKVELGRQTIVGVNAFQLETETRPSLLKIDPKLERLQIEKLARFKKSRNATKVRDVLHRLEDVAGSSSNLMPAVLNAVVAEATLGEISDALRGVLGVYKEQVVC